MKSIITKCCSLFYLLCLLCNVVEAQQSLPPDILYGQLFQEVQLQKIFPDGKTFVDCVPLRSVKDIMYDYGMQKGASFNLKKFVTDNFTSPPQPPQLKYSQPEKEISIHINNLWDVLKRPADTKQPEGSSLLALPYPYIVPGGRFREIYYWDSYFTMLGLKESGNTIIIENMVKNFAFLIDKYGHIPNGNRAYYITRSQPPFFSMMVAMLAGIKGNNVFKTYLPAMEKEYSYWMQGSDKLSSGAAVKMLVKLKDGTTLNRYWDEGITPRQESYKEDYKLVKASAEELAQRIRVSTPEALKKLLNDHKATLYKHLRAGAASGWDFSSRWFADGQQIATIQTTDIIPVDLNCLMYAMELNIAQAKKVAGNLQQAQLFTQKANKRKAAILKYCWSKELHFFVDYHIPSGQQISNITAAGLFPLFVKIATPLQANEVAATTRAYLLKDGGIVTTVTNTGQQWDAPNGWAPLQWVAVAGFKNYTNNELAGTIAKRWLSLNEKVYTATGKLMEKYNVEDLNKESGGGEYPAQDGFGWTNGVYLALKKLYR